MDKYVSILLIEDEEQDAGPISHILDKLKVQGKPCGYHLATTLEEALSLLKQHQFDLILADPFLVDSRAIDTFLALQDQSPAIPIILVGPQKEESFVQKALSQGAQDYIPKAEIKPSLLARTIAHAIERQKLEQSLRALSFTDELTGLYNRRGFVTLAEQHLSLAERMRRGATLFFLDIDYFKEINDTFGHMVGDEALQCVAKVLKNSFRRHDIIARIGGDEFAILSLNTTESVSEKLKAHLWQKLSNFNAEQKKPYTLSVSVGSTYVIPEAKHDLQALLALADEQLLAAKHRTHSKRTR